MIKIRKKKKLKMKKTRTKMNLIKTNLKTVLVGKAILAGYVVVVEDFQ
jgi:hypothetical protein